MMIFCHLRLKEMTQAGVALDIVINEAQRLKLGAGTRSFASKLDCNIALYR